MAVLATTHPTLMDVRARMNADGRVADTIEVLNQQNEVLDDAVWLPSNQATGHRTTVRTGLPGSTWRKLYGGVQPSKSTTRQITDTIGMLEAYAEVDKALADLNGNTEAWRMSEELAHVEGMGEKMAQYIFYGNEGAEQEAFTGLAPRFNSKAAANAQNIIFPDTGPTTGTNNTSIWLVVWGPNTVHCLYGKNGAAGLQIEDKGQVTIENIDGTNGRMEAYRTHFRWDAGLTVRDWRYVVRAQFDVSLLSKNAATGADLTDMMIRMIEQIPNLSAGRPAFYMGRNVRAFLRRQIVNKTTASTLSQENVAGKSQTTFDGIPIRRVDQILVTEAAIGA